MWRMTLILSLVFLLLVVFPRVLLLSLDSLQVPQWIEAGSSVELWCNYSYNATEGEELDVKWYLDGSPSPFLVWVPHQGRKPQVVTDMFKSHIDTGHTVGSDPYKKHSSLLIRNIHTGLSGAYTCKVSTFVREEYLSQRMTVFVKPRQFSFSVERKHNSVSLNCSGSEMFPEPSMRLFHGSRTIPVSDSVLVVNDYLSVSVHRELQLIDIQDTSLLGCSLHLPGTNFSITEEQIFKKYKPSRSSKFSRSINQKQTENAAPHLKLFNRFLLIFLYVLSVINKSWYARSMLLVTI